MEFPRSLLKHDFEVHSPLATSEVEWRLRKYATTGISKYKRTSSDGLPVLTLKGDSFSLWAVGEGRNPCYFNFKGKVVADGTGSALRGRVGPTRDTPTFFTVCFLLDLVMILALLSPGNLTPWVLAPISMGAILIGSLEFGCRWARRQWCSALDWLKGELDPSEDPPSDGVFTVRR